MAQAFPSATLAGVNVAKPTEDAKGQRPYVGNAKLANATFVNFLRCSRLLDERRNESEVHTCVAQNLASKTSAHMVDRYSQALVFPNEYTELFDCDPATTKLVVQFEDGDYDFFKCFRSNIFAPRTRIGVVLFKMEHGSPKILRLKM
jgi:hypothetical protein